jgi:hypothetical protein
LLLSNASSKRRPCIDKKDRLTTDYTGSIGQTERANYKTSVSYGAPSNSFLLRLKEESG